MIVLCVFFKIIIKVNIIIRVSSEVLEWKSVGLG